MFGTRFGRAFRPCVMGVFLGILLMTAAYAMAQDSDTHRGVATFYTVKSCQSEGTSGVLTANGERFDETALTCALRSHAFGGKYKVTNLANGKSIVVLHNDYGPGRGPTAKGVIIDLTPRGFAELGAGKAGKINVEVTSVEKTPLERPSDKRRPKAPTSQTSMNSPAQTRQSHKTADPIPPI